MLCPIHLVRDAPGSDLPSVPAARYNHVGIYLFEGHYEIDFIADHPNEICR